MHYNVNFTDVNYVVQAGYDQNGKLRIDEVALACDYLPAHCETTFLEIEF